LIVNLDDFRPKRKENVFTCCACEGQHFYMYQDGSIACRSCDEILINVEWMFREEDEDFTPAA